MARLEQEVRDLLDVSSVGLYEFIWIQRGREPDGQDDDRVYVGERALHELLAEEEDLRLVPLIWPGYDPVADDVRPNEPRRSDFEYPGDGVPYVALARD